VTDPTSGSESRGVAYGRRKFIPVLVIFAVVAVYGLATGHTTGARLFNGALLAWCAFFSWRSWKDPLPPRLQARLARVGATGEERFGSKGWHKAALALLVGLVLLFGALIIAASLQ
jgi:hypothetical protein